MKLIKRYQIGGYVQPSNVQLAINNGSAAGGLLEGFGKVMSKILPEWMLKAGTYMSPLNYAAALSKGSINPKVGEEVISKWHPNLLLAARTGEIILGGKAVKGAGKATVNTAAKAGNKTARAYLISKEIGKGAINLKELSNQFIEPHVTNPKGSGKVVHYDNGDGKSVFRNSGATIKDGKLVPGQTTRNQSNFTWWNLDNPYINVHKSQGRFSPSRYIITDLTNQFIHPLKAGKSVGQSDGAGRGFILPTELVSETPVSLENALIWNKSPFGWWERVKTLQPSKITKSKPYVRWSQRGYLNEAYDIDGGPSLKFQVVKDVDNPKKGVLQTKGNGEYSLHFKSSRNNPNKEGMFLMLAESIPEGGIVSTWGKISNGGYHGINRFGEYFGWTKVGERPAVNGPVNMFLKPSLLKTEDNPFKSNLDTKEFIQRFMYLNALHDPKHALSNPYSIVKPKAVNTSNKVQSIMNNIIFPRLLRNRPWMKNVGQNFNLGDIYEFDKDIFEKAGDPSEGFYNPKTGVIVRKRGSERFTPDEIDSHELRHRADAEYPYTEYEQQVTDRAFEGFLNAKPEDYGESYNMSVEIPTTISDARNTLLDANNMKEIPAHWEGPDKWVEASGTPWLELLLEEQDALINAATDTEIINAYRRSNGYGRRFILYLEDNKLLTPERIKDLREALIVGSLSAPLIMNKNLERK